MPNSLLEAAGYGIMVLFLVYTVAVLLKYVISTKRITMNEVYGAISIYVLLGVAFSLTYMFTTYFVADAFKGIEPGSGTNISSVLYFSFATLTTVGFGDIVAVSPIVRSIAMIEMIVGVFYLAVLVSKMVSALKE